MKPLVTRGWSRLDGVQVEGWVVIYTPTHDGDSGEHFELSWDKALKVANRIAWRQRRAS